MRWQQDVYGPLLERTLENAQVQHLAAHYDLSRDSRLARAIVREVNQELDREESRRQIQRVRAGELLLKTRRGPLVLPFRTEEDLKRVVSGERWPDVRRDILARCEARYRELFAEVSQAERKTSCASSGINRFALVGEVPVPIGQSGTNGPGGGLPQMESRLWN